MALTLSGLILAGGMAVSLAGGPSSYWVFFSVVTLALGSLPFVVLEGGVNSRGLATIGTAAVAIGLAFVLLFNLQILLILSGWVGLLVLESTMELGRKAVLLLVGAGLVMLAAAWSRAPDDVPVRIALALVGVAGIVLTFRPEGREQFVWYLALGALWLYLGLTAMIDARRSVGAYAGHLQVSRCDGD